MTAPHTPAAHTWLCTACGAPWPCPPRQTQFLADYRGEGRKLRALLGMFLVDATLDLSAPIEELHTRFVSWAPRQPPTTPESSETR